LHSKWGRYEAGTREEPRAIFSKFWIKLSFMLFLCCSYTSTAQRTFVALHFVCPMTEKWLTLANKLGKYWNVFDDNYMFGDGRFYPNLFPMARADKSSMMLLAYPISIWQAVCFLDWKNSYRYRAMFKIIINDRFLV